MHGVKRLFAWMIPRFDSRRFKVSLISLRRKDLSEETLEQYGVDVTYMGRHKFDPRTYPALLRVLRDTRADILHMHGYGATTFGRRRGGGGATSVQCVGHGDGPGGSASVMGPPLPHAAALNGRAGTVLRIEAICTEPAVRPRTLPQEGAGGAT